MIWDSSQYQRDNKSGSNEAPSIVEEMYEGEKWPIYGNISPMQFPRKALMEHTAAR